MLTSNNVTDYISVTPYMASAVILKCVIHTHIFNLDTKERIELAFNGEPVVVVRGDLRDRSNMRTLEFT